jgi:hypothetical protein
VAVTLEELQIKFSAEMGGLNSQLDGVKQQLGGVEQSTGKATSKLGTMAKAGIAFAGAMVGKALIGVGKEALQMANDVSESESLFDVSMGDMADSTRAWSKELSSSLGISEYAARKNVGVLNTMFKSMGLGKKPAADMAKNLTQLSEDMASFYNLDPKEAFTKLQAGITGEAEGLKRLGILVDEATVQSYALRKGIIKQGQTMTAQQKVAARYGAIIEQTGDAQGDLARTMESPTNQLRKLNTEMDNAKIALGQALQPALLAVMPALIGLAQGAENVIKALSGMGESDGLQNVLITLEEAREMAADVVGTGFADIAKNIEQASKDTDKAISDFETAEQLTKKVYLDISFNTPTVSGYELVTQGLATLRADIYALDGSVTKYISAYLTPLLKSGKISQETYDKRVAALQTRLDTLQTNAAKLESKIDAKIAAAMKDEQVTEEEKTAILAAITAEVNTATKDMTAVANAMKAQIAADLKAKKITPEEAAAGVALVDAELETALANLTATADNIKANVGIGDWNVITLTQEQTDSLAAKITASIESSNVVVKATIDEVQAEFTETGAIGLVVGTLYERMGTQITEQNGKIAELIAGWTSGLKPTAEQVKDVMEAIAERDRLLAMMNPELGISGAITMSLGNLTLDANSIKNYFNAINEAVTSETAAAETNFEAQKIRLANAAGMPEWDAVLAAYGLAGMSYEEAVEKLRQRMLAALDEKKNKAVIDAVAKLGPSLAAALNGDDWDAKVKAIFDIQSFLDNMNMDSLSAEAKQAILEMLQNLSIPTDENFTNLFGGGNPFQAEIDRLINSLTVDSSATFNIGAMFGQGLVNGMRSKLTDVIRAGEALSAAAKKAMRQGLMIQSPSKVSAEFGNYFGEGFALGIMGTTNRVASASASLGNTAINSLNPSAVNSTLGIQSSTPSAAFGNGVLELVIDGEKLGKVAIKNINDLQRRTGRAILNLG